MMIRGIKVINIGTKEHPILKALKEGSNLKILPVKIIR